MVRVHYCNGCDWVGRIKGGHTLSCNCGGHIGNYVTFTDTEYNDFLPIINAIGFRAWYRWLFGVHPPLSHRWEA